MSENLPLIDIEYYFLNIRARSVGEIVESKYKCENEVDGKVCGHINEVSFNILDTQVQFSGTKGRFNSFRWKCRYQNEISRILCD
jgi:hypothetical protein